MKLTDRSGLHLASEIKLDFAVSQAPKYYASSWSWLLISATPLATLVIFLTVLPNQKEYQPLKLAQV